MLTTLTDAWHTLVPPGADRHGPLAPMLVVLTVVTGLVDAFSYLVLGQVFVANMTGNVVFLGLGLAGAKGFAVAPHLTAIGAFSLGAVASGRLATRVGDDGGACSPPPPPVRWCWWRRRGPSGPASPPRGRGPRATC